MSIRNEDGDEKLYLPYDLTSGIILTILIIVRE